MRCCNQTSGSNPRQAARDVYECETVLKFKFDKIGIAVVDHVAVSSPSVGNDSTAPKALLVCVHRSAKPGHLRLRLKEPKILF
jgi:hypothetical protein